MSRPSPEFNLPQTVYVDFIPTKVDLSEWKFKFPDYNQKAIEDFKEAVPAEHRGYDPQTYEWAVVEAYAQTAADIIIKNFARVVVLWED